MYVRLRGRLFVCVRQNVRLVGWSFVFAFLCEHLFVCTCVGVLVSWCVLMCLFVRACAGVLGCLHGRVCVVA